jgi:hypothetical protein
MSAHIDFQVLNKRQTVGPQIVALHDAVRHVAKICRNGSARKRAPRARVEPRMDTWQPSCFSLAGRWRERQTAPSTLQTVRHRPRRFLAWMSFVLPILKVTASTRKKKAFYSFNYLQQMPVNRCAALPERMEGVIVPQLPGMAAAETPLYPGCRIVICKPVSAGSLPVLFCSSCLSLRDRFC